MSRAQINSNCSACRRSRGLTRIPTHSLSTFQYHGNLVSNFQNLSFFNRNNRYHSEPIVVITQQNTEILISVDKRKSNQ